jgi:ribosomal protein S18 acetylase RimI-like enzyme
LKFGLQNARSIAALRSNSAQSRRAGVGGVVSLNGHRPRLSAYEIYLQKCVAGQNDLIYTSQMLNYTIDHEWKDEPSQAVMNGLQNFNAAFIGFDNPQKLAVTVRDGAQKIVAGLLAQTNWNWMYIGWLWVDEKYRRRGIGKQLMSDAEREAKRLGCDHTHLTTLDFQAQEFYETLGYEVFAALEDYPRGHTRFMMKKKIR